MTNDEIVAKVQPRIYSAVKVPIEDRVPLKTPFSVHIDVSSICNYRCSFCFQADNRAMKKVDLKRGKMSVEMFKKIVNDLAEFPEKIKKIKIGNHGEPTLHQDLPEMIKYAKEKNVAEIIEVFTNGSKLTPELNRALVDAGLQRINVSIEGLSDERYMQVAGVKQNFNEIVEGVRHLHSIKGPELTIYVKIADQTSALDKGNNTTFILDETERQYFFDTFGGICDEIFIEKIVPQWAETQLDKQNEVAKTGMYNQKIKKYKDICPFTFMYLHFNCDGQTSPCTLDWPRKVVIGNVNEQSVKEIWEGKSLHQLRVAMLKGRREQINFCNNCSAPMVCVDEDLDPHKEKVLAALNALDESLDDNEWIQSNEWKIKEIL
ncbi:radical SAM/SPASM domain-containing protein [Shewanella sp. SP2S2-4]|uniref:Radical SAM/SPASM domain-containing protein n=1 Tax=Shewanella scandinavica TaxID=3063538 RepID=A0ABU3FWU7_9GAMM|nr:MULTISPECIES: radical SAM/SPASM domain-containing protein [unclassified Shewanella]MDT3274133.1 radical SAM/SPASM domain-containing protein [Shewanella sp. SP2S2-4]MDT3278757.1 radical SAM/SPASM domain-containing protein [Shewanella sp. SP2S1-2]MDT3294481.1 radical SAM/SPASM domain-containing protein [Shewanella sp. SP2S2-6]MDT3335048.1 radical SAM/SPASM domain-containing protein [Shewanella sp. SP1S1-7]